jgi:hypothetical protein
MFVGTLLFTEWARIPANWSYLIVISTNYAATYFLNAFYVFERTTTAMNATRFIVHAFLFWTLNNAFYSVLYYFTSIHYMLLVVVNVMLFTALRFLSMRWFVFGRPLHV